MKKKKSFPKKKSSLKKSAKKKSVPKKKTAVKKPAQKKAAEKRAAPKKKALKKAMKKGAAALHQTWRPICITQGEISIGVCMLKPQAIAAAEAHHLETGHVVNIERC